MPSFGEKLKQEREKRKITLDQISSSTKIGTRMLQALEADEFNQLPGGIFNKGFVRAYSRVVGLDEDQTVAEYLQASGDAPPIRVEPGGHEGEARKNNGAENVRRLDASADGDEPARQLPWGWFAAVLLIVALALSLWSHHHRERTGLPIAQVTGAAPLPGADNGVSTRANAGRSSAPGSPPTGSQKAGSEKTASLKGESALSVASKVSKEQTAAAKPGEFTVVVQAREESWVAITADGKTSEAETLAAGTERTIHARKEIVVKAGNAGGVDFRFNGKQLDIGGDYGEVKTVTFGPAGVVSNAPAPPSTP